MAGGRDALLRRALAPIAWLGLLLPGPLLALEGEPALLIRTSEEASAAGTALGFCRGQALSLAALEKKYPHLVPRARVTANRFRVQTGNACRDIEETMRHTMTQLGGADGWKQFEERWGPAFNKELAPGLAMLDEGEHIATAFLDAVDERADGKIDTPVARTLISASRQFRENPRAQWPRWTKQWVSAGHPKSHGARVQVRVPVAFTPEEPSAKHMLQKWVLPLGDNRLVMMSVSVFGLAEKNMTLAQAVADLRETKAEDIVAGFAEEMPGFVPLSSQRITLFGRPAIRYSGRSTMSKMEHRFTQHLDAVVGITPQGMVHAYCYVGGVAGDARLDADVKRYELLCYQFFVSLGEEAPVFRLP